MKVRLNHICHAPGCEGYPGEVIEVTPEKAQYLFDRRGAVPVGDDGVETATVTAPENAAKRVGKPPMRTARPRR